MKADFDSTEALVLTPESMAESIALRHWLRRVNDGKVVVKTEPFVPRIRGIQPTTEVTVAGYRQPPEPSWER